MDIKGVNVRSNKTAAGIVIILVALFFLYIAQTRGLLSIGVPTTSCTSLPGVMCAQQVNGAITSLSQVETASNVGGLTGTFWLVNLILNGQGQYLFSSSAQTIASAINSSAQVQNNYPISIQAKLNYQHLVIPYTYSGTNLYVFNLVPVDFSFGWFSQGAGFLTSYAQSNQTANSNTYIFNVSGPDADTDEQNIFNAYNNECTSLGGETFGKTNAWTFFGIKYEQAFVLSCYAVDKEAIAQVYSAGSPLLSENVQITYSNSTSSYSFNLTTQKPEQSYGDIALAQIVGYETGALNTYIGTTSPTLLVMNATGQVKVINPVSTATIQQYSSLPSYAFQPEGISVAGVPYNFILNQQTLQNAINQQNAQVESLINESLQTSNPYYGGKVYGYYAEGYYNPGTYSGAPYYYSINVTSNPVLYPDIQLIVNAKSLGIYIPVAEPKLISYSPNPVEFRSGSSTTVNFVVYNNASVAGSAYIVITAQNGTVVAQSPDFSIPADGQVSEPITISGYNPNLANLATTWTVTIYSAEDTAIHSSMNASVIIQPNCPPGYVYVNNTNCKNEAVNQTQCPVGEYYLNGTCYPICSPPAYYNTTTKSCSITPSNKGNSNIMLYVVIITAIIASAYVLTKRKGGATPRRKVITSAPAGKSHTFDYVVIAFIAGLFIYMAYIGFLTDFIILLFILGVVYIISKIMHPKININVGGRR